MQALVDDQVLGVDPGLGEKRYSYVDDPLKPNVREDAGIDRKNIPTYDPLKPNIREHIEIYPKGPTEDLVCIVDHHLPVGVHCLGAVSDGAVRGPRLEVVDGGRLSIRGVVELPHLTKP